MVQFTNGLIIEAWYKLKMIVSIIFVCCNMVSPMQNWWILKFQVHGSSSGVGTFAIQIAKYNVASVFVTANPISLFF